MKYRIKEAYIHNRIDGTLHHVWRRSDGSYYVTHSWLSKLRKGCFAIFLQNVR